LELECAAAPPRQAEELRILSASFCLRQARRDHSLDGDRCCEVEIILDALPIQAALFGVPFIMGRAFDRVQPGEFGFDPFILLLAVDCFAQLEQKGLFQGAVVFLFSMERMRKAGTICFQRASSERNLDEHSDPTSERNEIPRWRGKAYVSQPSSETGK
jgi:hypothetical protein